MTWEGPHIWVFSTNLRVLLGPSELNAKRASADSAWAGDDFLPHCFVFAVAPLQATNMANAKYRAFMANKYQCSSTRCFPISKCHHFPVHTHTRTHMYLCTGDKQINIYLYKYLKQQYLCIDLWCKLTHRLHYITLCYIINITLYSCYIDTVVFVALRQLPCVLLPVSCVTYAWNDITCTSTRTHVIYI